MPGSTPGPATSKIKHSEYLGNPLLRAEGEGGRDPSYPDRGTLFQAMFDSIIVPYIFRKNDIRTPPKIPPQSRAIRPRIDYDRRGRPGGFLKNHEFLGLFWNQLAFKEKGPGQMAKPFYLNMVLRGLRQSQSSAE